MAANHDKLIILGCGSSNGVPTIGPNWGKCNPKNNKNTRTRSSIFIKKGNLNILIDTSPDLRSQFLRSSIYELDAVLYTHEHADQLNGIADLRIFSLKNNKTIPAYATKNTFNAIIKRFDYCFRAVGNSHYKPILSQNDIDGSFAVTKGDNKISFDVFDVHHGNVSASGFKFLNIAYSPDLGGIPDKSLKYLDNLDLWIVDALRVSPPHPCHFHLELTLNWIEKMKPKKAILTNLSNQMDYETVSSQLPKNVELAYDGQEINL
jgi:phosphoribosyl 1,2-cyclic phosphate phosphodiesterase